MAAFFKNFPLSMTYVVEFEGGALMINNKPVNPADIDMRISVPEGTISLRKISNGEVFCKNEGFADFRFAVNDEIGNMFQFAEEEGGGLLDFETCVTVLIKLIYGKYQ